MPGRVPQVSTNGSTHVRPARYRPLSRAARARAVLGSEAGFGSRIEPDGTPVGAGRFDAQVRAHPVDRDSEVTTMRNAVVLRSNVIDAAVEQSSRSRYFVSGSNGRE